VILAEQYQQAARKPLPINIKNQIQFVQKDKKTQTIAFQEVEDMKIAETIHKDKKSGQAVFSYLKSEVAFKSQGEKP
jgi:hypothetical protein